MFISSMKETFFAKGKFAIGTAVLGVFVKTRFTLESPDE